MVVVVDEVGEGEGEKTWELTGRVASLVLMNACGEPLEDGNRNGDGGERKVINERE